MKKIKIGEKIKPAVPVHKRIFIYFYIFTRTIFNLRILKVL